MLWLHTVMLPFNLIWLWEEDVLTCKINTGGLNERTRERRELWLDRLWWMTVTATQRLNLYIYTFERHEIAPVLIHHFEIFDLKNRSTFFQFVVDLPVTFYRSICTALNKTVHILYSSSLFSSYFSVSYILIEQSHSIHKCFPSPQQSMHHNLIMKLADGPRTSRQGERILCFCFPLMKQRLWCRDEECHLSDECEWLCIKPQMG